ncbi:MAG TPA: hypothetical protein VIK72_04290 [Clostridiaceae bacterium]
MEVSGMLYSQIGYDFGDPMRALIRSTDGNYIKPGTVYEIIDCKSGQVILKGEVLLWGEIWHSSWWEIDFSALKAQGEYSIAVLFEGVEVLSSEPFTVGSYVLWKQCVKTVAIDQMEERASMARNNNGWKDCGSLFREVNSHASTIIGLCDLLSLGYQWLEGDEVKRLSAQIIQGCDYIGMCQDKSEKVGHPKGSIIHEIPNHMVVIPGDVAQSVVALSYASRLITELDEKKSDEYLERAVKAYDYLINEGKPYGKDGFSQWNQGAPEDYEVPEDFMTRDLLMIMWGGIELWTSGKIVYKDYVITIARKVLARQVTQGEKEGDFYGHFYTFDKCNFTEKANIHHHVGHDSGGTFPFYILPFMEMCSRWYDHPDAKLWRECINNFAYGFFLPACSKNPFYLIPEGYFKDEGLMFFCGPWHGINTSIAFGATLASRLEGFTGDRNFRKISVGNIQWIAGLNAGITKGSFKGCAIWREDIKEGVALPYSQIYGVGKRYVGNWTDIKGSICNGFSVNPQFQLAVKPSLEKDGPWMYTDEDWIPHGGGLVSALSYLRDIKLFADIEPM